MERVLNLTDDELIALAKMVDLGAYVISCGWLPTDENIARWKIYENACRAVYKATLEHLPTENIAEADETAKSVFRLSEPLRKETEDIMDKFREEDFRQLVCIYTTNAEYDAIYGPHTEKEARLSSKYHDLYRKNLKEIKTNDLKNLRLVR